MSATVISEARFPAKHCQVFAMLANLLDRLTIVLLILPFDQVEKTFKRDLVGPYY